MKKVLLVLIALVAFLPLVACQDEATTTVEGGTTTAETVELEMLWWSDGEEGNVMQVLLDEYKTLTGVEITLIPVAYNEYEARLATMISGDEAPDLARVTEGHLNNFQEYILPLDDVFTTSNFTNLFFNTDGEVIALPMDITANGLFVNLDLLDQYGVNYPTLGEEVWTWAEFETEMSKLKDQPNVAAPGVFDHQAHRFMPLVYQSGVTIWDEAYTSTNLLSTEVVNTVEMLMRFYEEGFLPRDTYVTKQSANLFRTGLYGFHLSGNWNVSGYQDLTFNWTVVPMPKGANRATILGGKSLAAFDGSGNEAAAKAFIAWMSEADQHDQYTGSVPFLTPRLGATVDYGDFSAEYNVFLDEINATDQIYVTDWLKQVMIPDMYPMINQFVEDCASGTAGTATELLTQLEADLIAAME
jgi:alpha-1,4-digalacturonate transport system substrate-binding protein